MQLKQVAGGVYAVKLGFVNAFIIDQDGLTVIDSGLSDDSARQVLEAVHSLGKKPADIKTILITHLHRDHTGGLAALKQASRAPATMHAADAARVRQGVTMRPVLPAPGLLYKLVYQGMGMQRSQSTLKAGVAVEHEVQGEERLPAAGGMRAIPTPGHTAGHLVYLWPQHGGVLFAGDALTHFMGVSHPPIYEDYRLAQTSLELLAGLEFDILCFSHGDPIGGGASQKLHSRIQSLAEQLARQNA